MVATTSRHWSRPCSLNEYGASIECTSTRFFAADEAFPLITRLSRPPAKAARTTQTTCQLSSVTRSSCRRERACNISGNVPVSILPYHGTASRYGRRPYTVGNIVKLHVRWTDKTCYERNSIRLLRDRDVPLDVSNSYISPSYHHLNVKTFIANDIAYI